MKNEVVETMGVYSIETPFSIVITTYNRKSLLKRCLNSIVKQNYEKYEIIVVDDHSEPCYRNEIMEQYPGIKFIVQDINGGPGPARNIGIQESENNYVILMDDDDVFKPEAFVKVNNFLQTSFDTSLPLFNFLISNAKIENNLNYNIYSFTEIIDNTVSGDLVHIINKKCFSDANSYSFPDYKIGAESLLWYRIAIDYGIPIVNDVIVDLCEDAEDRLTNISRQIKSSTEFAEYQLSIIRLFEIDILAIPNRKFLVKKYMAAITYLLLSGQKKEAIYNWLKLFKFTYKHLIIFPSFFLPQKTLISIFKLYRKK